MNRRRKLLIVLTAFAAAGPAHAFLSGVAGPLAKLEPGRWVVPTSGGQPPERALCVRDPALLAQLEHGAQACRQVLISNGARQATIQYSCPGRGFGHTSLLVETPRVVTIDTQGLIDGQPFAYRGTARRVGGC